MEEGNGGHCSEDRAKFAQIAGFRRPVFAIKLRAMEIAVQMRFCGTCLHLTGPRANQIIRLFNEKGREEALRALRLMLLIWIRDHADIEIVRWRGTLQCMRT